MTYKVIIKNYGSVIPGRPYLVEARLNGKLVNQKKECFHSLKAARRHAGEFFKGIDIEEDFCQPKMSPEQLTAAMKWYENTE